MRIVEVVCGKYGMKMRRMLVGMAMWTALVSAAAIAVERSFSNSDRGLSATLAGIGRWVSGDLAEYSAASDTAIILAPGDPIFLRNADGTFRQVGRVRNHFGPDRAEVFTRTATVVLYNKTVTDAFPDGFMLEYQTIPTSLDWVVQTMVTPERQAKIAQILERDWKNYREEILVRLQPVFEKSLITAAQAIEAELPVVMRRHRAGFQKLGDRYQHEIVRRQIIPLVREEILPIIQEESQPLVASLARELWDRVSLWSFTWRYLYDVSPLPERAAVKKEFSRFMDEEFKPAVFARSEEFVTLTEKILRRISSNERVRATIRDNLLAMADDQELQKIVWNVVQDAFVDNITLRQSLREYWASTEVRNAIDAASEKFEPSARAIGDAFFGTREEGITPEFARVLRAQILLKDRRWLIVVPRARTGLPRTAQENVSSVRSVELRIVRGSQSMEYPLEFATATQSPLSELADPVTPSP